MFFFSNQNNEENSNKRLQDILEQKRLEVARLKRILEEEKRQEREWNTIHDALARKCREKEDRDRDGAPQL